MLQNVSSPVTFIITFHEFPLLALAWRSVEILGHPDQTDLLEILLSEESACADSCCFCFLFLNWHLLKFFRLTEANTMY